MGCSCTKSATDAEAPGENFKEATKQEATEDALVNTEVQSWSAPEQPDVLPRASGVDADGQAKSEAMESTGGMPHRDAESWQPPGVPMDDAVAVPPAAKAPDGEAVRGQYDDIFGDKAFTPEAARVQGKAVEVYTAYFDFFNHLALRKGWRVAPICQEEVQVPFWTAAQTVALVRADLDRSRGEGIVLRQVVGSSMEFLWSWDPHRRLGVELAGENGDTLREFVSGLVFATLSDGRGLVEGLQSGTVEAYVDCHPIWRQAAARVT